MVSLTGDIGTGKKVLAAAQATVKRTHLELGGKAPVIVFDDADLDAVVEGVRSFGFYNAGQDCTAACRIYAGSKIYDKLVADLSARRASAQVQSAQTTTTNEIGPLISARQRARVAGFVERALASPPHRRSPPAASTPAGKGFFYEPTVVAGALQTDEIVRREVFGPVVSVTPLQRCRSGGRPGPTIPTTASPPRCGRGYRAGHGDGGAASLRLHLGQLPLHARQRDAAWRPQASGYGKDLSMYALEDYTCRAPCDGEDDVVWIYRGGRNQVRAFLCCTTVVAIKESAHSALGVCQSEARRFA